METKMIRVPFDVEIAKKITNCEEKGRVVTRDGRSARVVCFDMKSDDCIVAIIQDEFEEHVYPYPKNGLIISDRASDSDLMLEIPEYMTFKDGDVLVSGDGNPFIYKDEKGKHGCVSAYFGIDKVGNEFFDSQDWTCRIKGKADDTQHKALIDALKANCEPKAKEYLKRFFGIEQKKEYEFKPFDKVLVRNSLEIEWIPRFFERATQCYESIRYITLDNNSWKYCIPYNENTAHLLGTIEDWEEKQ